MKILVGICLVMMAGVVMAAQEVQVMSDRVNVRSRPLDVAEVLGQVNRGDWVTVLKVEGAWAEVQAPTNLGVWIKREFVHKGVVTTAKVKVRSGPGVSYRDVGLVRGGTAVQQKEERGDWICIAPPDGILLWVSTEFLDMEGRNGAGYTVTPSETGVVSAVDVQMLVTVTNATVTNLPAAKGLPEGVKESQLAAVLGQGAVLERQGVLERVPLAIFRGVEYRLVEVTDGGREVTCFLRGREAEMPGLIGKRIKVKGRAWWLSGGRCPLLYPDEVASMGE